MDVIDPPAGITIETLTLDQKTLGEISRVATEAFYDDPFFVHLIPAEGPRRRALGIFFTSQVAEMKHATEVYGARRSDGTLVGVAAFVRPGTWPMSIPIQVRQLWGALRAMLPTPRSLIDGSRYLFAIEGAHPKETLWYLYLLAVDPAAQRGGIGGALQSRVYPRADEEGLPSYLETQKEDNLVYYRRFGYEVERELHPVKTGPPLWTMRRQPRPPEA